MVGSYPRPAWFTHQLAGKDVLEAFKIAAHAEAFHDATRTVIKDQEDAGLDILTDGQMWFDDYHMGIGSFLWYWLERTKGIGLLSAEDALALGQSGPILRASGVNWDMRKAMPYLAYDEVDFDVPAYEKAVAGADAGGDPPADFRGHFVFGGVRADRREYARVAR